MKSTALKVMAIFLSALTLSVPLTGCGGGKAPGEITTADAGATGGTTGETTAEPEPEPDYTAAPVRMAAPDGFEQAQLAAADKRIAEIRAAADIDPATVSGTCYYVSSINGNDDNDGLTPATAWKTINRLMEHSHKNEEGLICSDLLPGDAVFFERGSLFRGEQHTNESGDYALPLCYGVTYSAYGEGEKPEFRNSYDASSPSDWEATEYENIWVYTGSLKTKLYSVKKPDPFVGDIGNIVFNNGAAWGIKVVPGDMDKVYSDEKPTVNCSTVTNGIEVFHSGDVILSDPGCIENNLEFLHDHLYNKLYLRCNEGNPGECFDSIELSRRGSIIRSFYYEVDNEGANEVGTVIDNLCLRYSGGHAVDTWGASNLTVQNCEMGWLGGSFQDPASTDDTRYGNAFQNWNECEGIYCRNNYIYQCYDTGLTCQGAAADECHMNDIDFSDNVITHCTMAFELWNACGNGDPALCSIADAKVCDNYILYTGYGFGHQRPGNRVSCPRMLVASDCAWNATDDILFDNNKVLYMASGYLFRADYPRTSADETGLLARGNNYLLRSDKVMYVVTRENLDQHNENGVMLELWGDTADGVIQLYTEKGFEYGSVFYTYDHFVDDFEEKGAYLYDDRLDFLKP